MTACLARHLLLVNIDHSVGAMKITCHWPALILEKIILSVLFCVQISAVSLFAAAVLPFLVEVIALSTKLREGGVGPH